MHRDLKPANLLISAKGELKIADLGLSRVFARNEGRLYSHQVATRWYRAPELLYGARKYTEAVDLWAVGCILGELLTCSPVFPGENDIDQLGLVIRTLGTPNERIWPGVRELPDYSKITFPEADAVSLEEMVPDAAGDATDLFSRFITYNSSERISARAALRHEYFSNLPTPARLSQMPLPGRAGRGKDSGARAAAASAVGGVGKEYEINQSFAEVFEDLLELHY